MADYYQQQQQPELDLKKFRPIIFIVAALVLVTIFWSKVSVTIPSGHAGVLYKQFGNGVDKDEVYGQGFTFIAPWNHMIIYETRQKERTETMEILSSNLLKIMMDVTILYQPKESEIGFLEVERGRDYEQKVVTPFIRSVVREIMANYLPEEINSTKREAIEVEIKDRMSEKLAENYIKLNSILIRNIKLPQTLQEAIERKLKQEQEAQEYEFKLQKEKLEAQRKMIEAKGVQDFQDIVNKSITDKLLKWKGIEATLELAKSPNAKVVVIGNGDGMPLILGND